MTKHGEVIDFLSEITAGKRTEIGLAPECQFGVSREVNWREESGNVVDYRIGSVTLALVQSLYGRFGSYAFLAQSLVSIAGPSPLTSISPKKPAGDYTATQSS